MIRLLSRRGFLGLSVIALFFVAGCGGGGSDDDVTESTATSAPAVAEVQSTEVPPTPTSTAVPTSTATPSPPTPTPTPTHTPTPTPIPEVAIGDVRPIDPSALPNFTLSLAYDTEGVPDQEVNDISLEIQQSSTDNYHLLVNTDAAKIETWAVDGTTYLKQGDGSVVALPSGTDAGLFSPTMFVQTIPQLDPAVIGTAEGTEMVNGRETLHYHVDGDDFLSRMVATPAGVPTNVDGSIDIWLDKELRVMIKQAGNVTWTNPDGSPGSLSTSYEIRDIGNTPWVEAPQ